MIAARLCSLLVALLLWLPLILVSAREAGAQLTVKGWLDFYEGRTQMPAEVGKIAATSYALGIADGAITLQVMICPKDYIPEASALARQTAKVLRTFPDQPDLSVTVAVLAALSNDGCKESSQEKAK